MRLRAGLFALCAFISAASLDARVESVAQSGARTWRLWLDVWCEVGTEQGGHHEEEIYIVFTVNDGDGTVHTGRAPGSGHTTVECHNRGSRRLIRNFAYADLTFAPGQASEVTFVVMEEDQGGQPPELSAKLAEAGRETAKDDTVLGTIIQIGAAIIGMLKDDHIGTVGARAEFVNGQIRVSWAPRENGSVRTVGDHREIFLNGAGADIHLVPRPWDN